MKINLDIIKEEKAWAKIVGLNKKSVKKMIETVLDHFPRFSNSEVEVALMLTNDEHMQKLNNEFRGKNKPTNVLSFPDREFNRDDLLELCNKKDYIYLGDVALGYDTVKFESDERNIPIYEHITHLIVHSILHLLGYDHEEAMEAEEMMCLEIAFLKSLSIKSPY
jgi:probable rRNA maturation factor